MTAFGIAILAALYLGVPMWVITHLIRFGRALAGRGEVADVPVVEDIPQRKRELPPCGMRIALTREQVDAAIADLDKQFPKTKDRRIR